MVLSYTKVAIPTRSYGYIQLRMRSSCLNNVWKLRFNKVILPFNLLPILLLYLIALILQVKNKMQFVIHNKHLYSKTDSGCVDIPIIQFMQQNSN